MTLYELTEGMLEFKRQIEAGEIPDEAIEDTLEMLNLDVNEKIENIALYIKTLVAQSKAIRDEEINLEKRRRVLENRAERLKNYLKDSMMELDINNFETTKTKISFRRSVSVDNINLDLLDEEYKKVAYKPDKTAIKLAIQSGIDVKGATIVEKQNLQIK